MAATVASAAGVRRLPRPRPVASAPSTTGTPTAGTRWPPAVALRHLELHRRVGRARQRARRAPSSSARCSTSASRRCRRCGDIRRRGLMTRHRARAAGRRSAVGPAGLAPACVRRGVLIRPLGDVIVLCRRSTVTADEIERIVDVLAASIDEVCDDAVTPKSSSESWPESVEARNAAIAEPDAGARSARSTAAVPTFDAGRRAHQSCRSRRTTTSASPSTRRSSRPRPRRARTVGHRAPGRPASSSGGRPVHPELEAELAAWKRRRSGVAVPHGFRRQPRRARRRSARRRRARRQRRAQPRLDHRRLPAVARPRSTIARHGDVDHVDALLRGHDGAARSS